MIISRYLIKEALNTLLAVTLVLLLLFLSNILVRYLTYAAAGKIPVTILLQLIGLEIPYLLTLLLPLGLYLGIISAYGRLYADNELRVMQACGLSTQRLVVMTGYLAIFITLIVTGLTVWVNPMLANEKDKLLAKRFATDNLLETLVPGRFQETGDGSHVVYVEKISRDHKRADNIFIAEQKKSADEKGSKNWALLSAEYGYQTRDPVTQDRFVVAMNGYRYEGTPGQNNYQIIQFKKYTLRVPTLITQPKSNAFEVIPTRVLWDHYKSPHNAAELQWRFSMPLSTLLLAMLAIPLSQIQPRQSRYVHLFPAILIYIIYINLLFVARNWIGQRTVSIDLGMWWIHAMLFVLAVLLIFWQTGKLAFSRWFIRRKQ